MILSFQLFFLILHRKSNFWKAIFHLRSHNCILAECQDAIGTVMHTKKMDDGDYKFFLNVEEPFKFLVNDKNNDETEGFLVVEIVPPHQDGMYLPKDGDRVHVWCAWVTDKPKGWHEIHPTRIVVNQ